MIVHPAGCPCLICGIKAQRSAESVKHPESVKQEPVKHPRLPALDQSRAKRRAGLKGGPARAAALSPTRRREIAQLGARARWAARGPS